MHWHHGLDPSASKKGCECFQQQPWVDMLPSDQPDANVQVAVEQPSPISIPHSAAAAHGEVAQQAQQWVIQSGVQSSINELVAYVGSLSAAKAQQLQHAQHSDIHMQLSQLQLRVRQQTSHLQKQQEELDVLRSLQQTGSGNKATQIYQELERRQQEMVTWRTKFQLEQQCRDTAESALKETLVVVDQLAVDCAAISSMLKDVHAVETASAMDTAPSSSRKAVWGAAAVLLAVMLVVCTAAATYLITRTLALRSAG